MQRINLTVDSRFNLDGLRMNAVQTAANGVVSRDTIFCFTQQRDTVWASYAGGRIERGFLVGVIADAKLTFHYCQLETGATLNSGQSSCELQWTPDGLLEIIEHFQWTSGAGTGLNIIREIRS